MIKDKINQLNSQNFAIELSGNHVLTIPRVANDTPLSLDLTDIITAENRLSEISILNSATAPELSSTFNVAANVASRHLAWLSHEIACAKFALEKVKARINLVVLPEKIKELKEVGIKSNEDVRNALLIEDPEGSYLIELINYLNCVKDLIEGKFWSIVRAYDMIKTILAVKQNTPTGV